MAKNQDKKAELEIIKLKIGEIVPYANNPRHNDETIEALVKSITKYGYKVPISVDEDYVVLSGHARLAALKQIFDETEEVDCVIVRGLSDQDRRAFRIADNKIPELSEWNDALLTAELRTVLDLEEFTEMGFNEREIQNIMGASMALGGFSYSDVNIDSTYKRLTGKFEKMSVKVQGDYIKVVCKLCGEAFYLSRKELKELHKYINVT